MAEEKQPKMQLPRLLAAHPTKKARKIKSETEMRSLKQQADTTRGKTRISIGIAFQRWRELKEFQNLKSDATVAVFLLDRNMKASLDSPLPVRHSPLPVSIKKKKDLKRKVSAILDEVNLPKVNTPLQTASLPKKKKQLKQKTNQNDDIIDDVTRSEKTPTLDGKKDENIKKKKKKSKKKEELVKSKETDEKKKKKKKKNDATERNINNQEQTSEQGEVNSWMAQLREFIPDVDKKSPGIQRTLLHYDLPRFIQFKEQGVSIRRGRCSRVENERIKKNVADFLVLTGIPLANQLLFPQRYPEETANIKQLRAKHGFMVRIAEGVPRTCQQALVRAKKIFDEWNRMGCFSEAELKSLVKLQNRYGNDWRKISGKMGRSIYALQKRFSSIVERKGSWDSDEEEKLKLGVRNYLENIHTHTQEHARPHRQEHTHSQEHARTDTLTFTRSQLCYNLPWKKISEKVGTRSEAQCRFKWFSLLKCRLSPEAGVFRRRTTDGLQAKIQLISMLYNSGVDDAADVDWDKLTESISKVTHMCLQKSFHRLKVSKVPNWSSLTFGEIIDVLWSKVLPGLKAQLKNTNKEENNKTETGNKNKEVDCFSLADIFS